MPARGVPPDGVGAERGEPLGHGHAPWSHWAEAEDRQLAEVA